MEMSLLSAHPWSWVTQRFCRTSGSKDKDTHCHSNMKVEGGVLILTKWHHQILEAVLEEVSLHSVGARIEAMCFLACRSLSAQLGHKDVTKFKHSPCFPLALTITGGEINHSSS